MCGIIDTLVSVITDVGLTAVGAPELIPAANAAESFGEGLASGEGVGKAAIGGLESGGMVYPEMHTGISATICW